MVLEKYLSQIDGHVSVNFLDAITRGLEKENCRIDSQGRLAQTPHPAACGKPLTHAAITTDFSESLVELITPPIQGISPLMADLQAVNCFFAAHLGEENLWPFSMPPEIADPASVPIADYGSSDVARMKSLYRLGLSHRYGRVMQMIAGFHVNVSFPEPLFQAMHGISQAKETLADYRSQAYMNLIQQFQRHAWLLMYLFGASPACAKQSVMQPRPYLKKCDANSYYAPWGTSLRMSDIGYQNSGQKKLKINDASVQQYADSLLAATQKNHPEFEKIGVRVNGQYRQLNSHVLQIENEYYSLIRPKPAPQAQFRPAWALKKYGVAYVEVRLMDLNPMQPLGIDATSIAFVDLMLMYCLLAREPVAPSHIQAQENFQRVCQQGRDPALKLLSDQKLQPFKKTAQELLHAMEPLACWMDAHTTEAPYHKAWQLQLEKVHHPEATPSAQLIQTLRSSGLSYQQWGHQWAQKQTTQMKQQKTTPATALRLQKEVEKSYQLWLEKEQQPKDFERFLNHFFKEGRYLW